MDCVECQDNLSAYIEEELVGPERQKISEHMNGCPSCAAEYQSLARTHQLVTENIMIQASPALWSRIEAQIQASAIKPAPVAQRPERTSFLAWLGAFWNPLPRRAWAGALAAIILVSGLTYVAVQQLEKARIEQAMQQYIQERDRIEQTHSEQIQPSNVAETNEYEDNPFVLEDRHQEENPFKL